MLKKFLSLVFFTAVMINLHAQPPSANEPDLVEEGSLVYINTPSGRIYVKADTQPEFPGGRKELDKSIALRIDYPKADRENKVQGNVILSFVVEADGSLSNINPVSGPSQTLITASIKAIKQLPKWKPGLVNGQPVRVRFTIPVNFELK